MNDVVNNWYLNFSIEYNTTIDEAKNIVSAFDVTSFENQAKEYVKNRDFSDKANYELKIYNLKMKENRLNLLLEQLRVQALSMYDELEAELYKSFNELAEEVYAESAGILAESARITKQELDALLYTEYNGDSFSSAIWKNKRALLAFLEQEIPLLILSGANPVTLARKLAELLGVELYKAKRILRTEGSRVQSKAQEKYYKDNNIKRYEFVAEHGPKTCKVCLALDGKKFKVEDFEEGKNAQPMHPNCRCTTIPVVE